MPPDLLQVLLQLPIVGIFIWFILERDKRQFAETRKNHEEWREFLKGERVGNNSAIARIAEEVKSATQQLAAMNTLLITHDMRVQEYRLRERESERKEL